MPTYYTSAGVPTAAATPWTSPPTESQVRAYHLLRSGAGRTASAQIVNPEAVTRAAQTMMARDPSLDPDVATSIANKILGAGGGAAAPAIETAAAPVDFAPAGDGPSGTTLALVGLGIVGTAAGAWYLFLR